MTGGKASFEVLFEHTAKGWVPVLDDSALVTGHIASQNAGSTNANLYYQLGGEGMNKLFFLPLDASGQADDVNAMLRKGYDACYGKGAFAADSKGRPPRTDRLTSLLIELVPDGKNVGKRVVAMAYSVGPVLGPAGIVDDAGYQQIYFDAVQAIDAWNQPPTTAADKIAALRITMVSCGLYATKVHDPDKLFRQAAADILAGVARAVSTYPDLDGFTVLVNTNDHASPPRERPAFTAAATALGIKVRADGFTVDAAAVAAGS